MPLRSNSVGSASPGRRDDPVLAYELAPSYEIETDGKRLHIDRWGVRADERIQGAHGHPAHGRALRRAGGGLLRRADAFGSRLWPGGLGAGGDVRSIRLLPSQ